MSATDGVLQFRMSDAKKRFKIAVNLADEARRVPTEAGIIAACTVLHREGELVTSAVQLEPGEAMIIDVHD